MDKVLFVMVCLNLKSIFLQMILCLFMMLFALWYLRILSQIVLSRLAPLVVELQQYSKNTEGVYDLMKNQRVALSVYNNR